MSEIIYSSSKVQNSCSHKVHEFQNHRATKELKPIDEEQLLKGLRESVSDGQVHHFLKQILRIKPAEKRKVCIDECLEQAKAKGQYEFVKEVLKNCLSIQSSLYSWKSYNKETNRSSVAPCDLETELHLAIFQGHHRFAELLLDVDSQAYSKYLKNETNSDNHKSKYSPRDTPLHVAVAKNDLKMVKLLIQYGHDLNQIRQRGETPFYMAVQNGNLDMAEFLLQNGADLNCPARYFRGPRYVPEVHGNFPLHVAVKLDNPLPMVNFLLQNGAYPLSKSGEKGVTPFCLAVLKDEVEVLDSFIKQIRFNDLLEIQFKYIHFPEVQEKIDGAIEFIQTTKRREELEPKNNTRSSVAEASSLIETIAQAHQYLLKFNLMN